MSDLQDSSPVSGVTAVRLDGRGGAQPLEPLRALAPDSVPVWIHIDYDDPEAAEWTRKESGLEETIVAAMLDPESRPRCVQYGGGLLTMLRGVNLNPGARLEDMISVRIWLEPGRVVTAARRKLRSLTETRQSLDRGDGPGTPAILVAGLIERLNRHIGDGIEQIEAEIDNAEDNIRLSSGVRSASAFNRLRRQTAQIRRYLSPQREALDRLSRITEPLFKPDETIELREQLNRLTLALEDLELVRERALVAQEEFLGPVHRRRGLPAALLPDRADGHERCWTAGDREPLVLLDPGVADGVGGRLHYGRLPHPQVAVKRQSRSRHRLS
jgi:zinc transporter